MNNIYCTLCGKVLIDLKSVLPQKLTLNIVKMRMKVKFFHKITIYATPRTHLEKTFFYCQNCFLKHTDVYNDLKKKYGDITVKNTDIIYRANISYEKLNGILWG